VLLDVDLPGLDGHSVHERLRAERPGAYAVVFITGNAGDGDQTRALRAGALDYVAKPVSYRTLASKIPLWRERALG
jgi:DNA-binding response OmpR family regulator